jgi:hypothetical protein
MAKQRNFSTEFKRQVVLEDLLLHQGELVSQGQ